MSTSAMRRLYGVHPGNVARFGTDELRAAFLIPGLFEPGCLHFAYCETDRMVVAGVVPVDPLVLPDVPEFGGGRFLDRREAGILNLGPPGIVRVDGAAHALDTFDALYIGRGAGDISFEPCADSVPEFYLVSCLAWESHPVVRIARADATAGPIGDADHASARTIYKYIHAGGARSCQLTMGLTELQSGSVWNTMPAHTHGRRSEIYLYDGLDDGFVVHLMGEPRNTRHLIVRNRQAVMSPPWSLHAGAGTRNYRFVWAMAGENQDFSDMDPLPLSALL